MALGLFMLIQVMIISLEQAGLPEQSNEAL